MDPLTVPPSLDALAAVRAYVERAAAEAGLDPARAYRLVLGVDEIVANTLNHGYGAGAGDDGITVSARSAADELQIVVEDAAPPFDPRDQPIPAREQLAAAGDRREAGGLGLYLARTGVDRFDYERAEGRNRTTLAMTTKPERTEP
jgi:anti-sigma regulatory factor (Ser/Thr protein kinase)